MPSSGIAPGDILADSGYSHRVPGTWAQPPRAAGANLVQDLHPNDRGPQGIHQGAIIASGSLYCPATPGLHWNWSRCRPAPNASAHEHSQAFDGPSQARFATQSATQIDLASPRYLISTIRYSDSMEEVTAGALLRQARSRADLSQVDLAARAGVSQSVISAYESGQRQPSIPTLSRLVGAAGFDLALSLRRPPGRLSRLSGPVGRRVRRHRKDLVAAAAAHAVSNLRVFGSVARGEDHPASDVDLLADFPPGLSLFGLGRLEADLEGILGTRVDLISAADLKPGIQERVESDLIAL
jgi:predicted nucleotidyltransferase/ribosome-binding protein aMBF1 (putative translation factor)